MAEVINIPPNFGIREFDTVVQAGEFLQEFGFEVVSRRSDYEVWETTKEPKIRALKFEVETGRCVVKQLLSKDHSP